MYQVRVKQLRSNKNTMAFLKINMNLQFPSYPLIFMWIQNSYNKCSDILEYEKFMWQCFDIANETKNEVKKQAYYNTACVIYSKLTGRSWECLDNKLIEWQNK